MEKRTRVVDAKGRATLFPDFARCIVTVERVGANEVRIRKRRRSQRKYTLAQLVSGITRKNRHAEVSTGKPVGGEAW
jgi:hypothetical protein